MHYVQLLYNGRVFLVKGNENHFLYGHMEFNYMYIRSSVQPHNFYFQCLQQQCCKGHLTEQEYISKKFWSYRTKGYTYSHCNIYCQIAFLRRCTALYFHQQCMKLPVPVHPDKNICYQTLIVASLVGIKKKNGIRVLV